MNISDEQMMKAFGERVGRALGGGEVLELIGDVGAGKTTFTKGLARGLGITEPVQSPTFTISRVYEAPGGLSLYHYDFYRISEAGIMGDELAEVLEASDVVTVVEWAQAIDAVLPPDRVRITITATGEDERTVAVQADGPVSTALWARVKEDEA